MIRRSRLKHKFYFVALMLGIVVIYNEFVCYEIQAFKWPIKTCKNCVKVLLVADPQILGFRSENYRGSSWAVWDSDRYLDKTYSRALRRARPHVVVFLGDLMDEGHYSPPQEFSGFKKRLDAIFYTPENIMKIYLPGDNDIGGEQDIVSFEMNERFNFAFTQPDTLVYNSATFFKVNRLTKFMPTAPQEAFLSDYAERNTTNVVLSHLPLLYTPGTFVQNVLKELSPQVIFTAHDHRATHLSLDTATDQLSETWILPPHKMVIYQLRLDIGDIHEIQIPTCSYRMGTRNMGFGLAYIDTQDKTLDFTVLWLPDRFHHLWIYLYALGTAVLLSLLFVVCNACSKSHATYTRLPLN